MCQWEVCNSLLQVNSFANIDSNIFAGTSVTGNVYKSTNNGNTWIEGSLYNRIVYSLTVSGNDPEDSEKVIFAGTSLNGVYLSSNSGLNWTQTSLNNITVWSLISNGQYIYAGTNNNGVYITSNNGINWTNTSLNNVTVLSLTANGGFIIAGTYLNGIFVTSNNGINWVQASLNDKTVWSFTSKGAYVFAGTNTGVYYSENNGYNWLSTSMNNYGILSLTTYNTNIIAGTYGFGVYLSQNNGTSWSERNEGFPTVLPYVSSLLVLNNYIFAGTTSHIIYRRSLQNIIGIKKISAGIPSEFSLGQNYPNPFNSVTSIKFKVTSEGGRSQKTEVRLKVYDLNGREIRTLVNEELNPGTYEVRLDAGDIPSGIYFYRMQTEKFTETRKLILLK
jgi:hypothetical protein